MSEYISTLTDDEIRLILHPKTGVVARCEFLPKIADLVKIVDEPKDKFEAALQQAKAKLLEEEATREKFRPHTAWKKIDEPEIEVPPLDRRKQVVAEVLGYDPQDARSRRRAEPPAFATVKIEDLKSSDDLKTPPRPISPEMRQFLIEQGWPHVPPEQGQ